MLLSFAGDNLGKSVSQIFLFKNVAFFFCKCNKKIYKILFSLF